MKPENSFHCMCLLHRIKRKKACTCVNAHRPPCTAWVVSNPLCATVRVQAVHNHRKEEICVSSTVLMVQRKHCTSIKMSLFVFFIVIFCSYLHIGLTRRLQLDLLPNSLWVQMDFIHPHMRCFYMSAACPCWTGDLSIIVTVARENFSRTYSCCRNCISVTFHVELLLSVTLG